MSESGSPNFPILTFPGRWALGVGRPRSLLHPHNIPTFAHPTRPLDFPVDKLSVSRAFVVKCAHSTLTHEEVKGGSCCLRGSVSVVTGPGSSALQRGVERPAITSLQRAW